MSLFDDPEVGVPPEPTLSVGELADRIGNAVRASFRDEVWVRGEIQDLSRPASGHVYFTLTEVRDDGSRACLSVMLSAANKVAVNRSLTRAGDAVRMVDGTEVRIRGRLDWYSPRGQLQLRMTAIDPAYTLGQLEVARAELLAALAAEGLLRRNGELRWPLVPLRIGLVTSSGSAAEADFLHELERSGLAFSVLAVDARVQGHGAPRSLASAIATLGRRGCDVVAVVRGGGARTDLAAFDHPDVARAIARCSVPVATGIGHEVDRSVADEVAHTAAKTPTACAQLLVAQVREHLGRLESGWTAVAGIARRDLQRHQERLDAHAARASRSTRAALDGAASQLAGTSVRLRRAAAVGLQRGEAEVAADARRIAGGASIAVSRAEHHLDRASGRVTGSALSRVREATGTLREVERRVARAAPRVVEEAQRGVDSLDARIRALDPQRALARGWSITRTADGAVVRSPADVAPGDHLVTQTAGGDVRSTVDPDG